METVPNLSTLSLYFCVIIPARVWLQVCSYEVSKKQTQVREN